MKYNAQFFRNGLPDWKRKKDPIVVKLIFRPLSFYTSAFCGNRGLTANKVTLISIVVGLLADFSAFLSFQNRYWSVVAAALLAFWLLLDCTDGNLARSVKREPFGDFLDGLGGYVIMAFLVCGFSVGIYFNGGLVFMPGDVWIIVLGAIATECDLLMRLAHQKFLNNKHEMETDGMIEKTESQNHGDVMSFKTRVNMELGLGGIMVPVIFLFSILGWLDLVVVYMFLYNAAGSLVSISLYIKKAMNQKSLIDEK